MSHSIRLHGFWEKAEAGELTTHSRNFGKPRVVDQAEHVWLICSILPSRTEIRLNGDLIATTVASGPFAAEITPILRARNTVSFTTPRGECPGEVGIEIRRAS